ncbi:olfactory receptor 11A1-like [Betta splendens]|uniref:Olfactory receptor n=1 Tax=Betta splendens TaxID=158456 RepID=A0A6P7LCX7_BETSP|nr:olfactory receptor 11A1-like [Betta splendens]
MDDRLNVTYLTLDGFVELHKFRYVYFLIMFTVYVLIIVCNSTIVCLIWIHKSLHEPMYVFIAALLINSLLYSTNIYPKLLTDSLSAEATVTYKLCLFQSFVCYSLASSEFLLLAAMAYDRYVSICKPLEYPSIMRRPTVLLLLAVCWLLPVCELAVSAVLYANMKPCSFTLKGIFCNNSIYTVQCVRSLTLAVYGIFMLVNMSLFPFLFILFTYSRILLISYNSSSSRTVRTKATHTCLPHLLVLINYSCFLTYDIIIVRLDLDFTKVIRFIMTLQMILYHPLFNPIIYGLKMKEISKHLKRLMSGVKDFLSMAG